MVCAETSNRRARSSTITRPKARAIFRISDWRWDRPVTMAPWANEAAPWCGRSGIRSTRQIGRNGGAMAERPILVKATCAGNQPHPERGATHGFMALDVRFGACTATGPKSAKAEVAITIYRLQKQIGLIAE